MAMNTNLNRENIYSYGSNRTLSYSGENYISEENQEESGAEIHLNSTKMGTNPGSLSSISNIGSTQGSNPININSSNENDEDEMPMALIVEDEEICQNFLQNQLKEMKIQTRCAASVEEAKKVYLELTSQGISIDIVFLDIYLKDKSTGIQLLKIIRENNWIDRALIISSFN